MTSHEASKAAEREPGKVFVSEPERGEWSWERRVVGFVVLGERKVAHRESWQIVEERTCGEPFVRARIAYANVARALHELRAAYALCRRYGFIE